MGISVRLAFTVLILTIPAWGTSGTTTTLIIANDTISPNGRYAVSIPRYNMDDDEVNELQNNKIIDLHTTRVLTAIQGDRTGFDLSLNGKHQLPARWAADSSILVWEVDGKWSPNTLVVVHLEHGKVIWQKDLLQIGQRALLEKTKKSAPERYAASKKQNAGNGSAYPDGFTVSVKVSDPVSMPVKVRAFLSSNPKQIEWLQTLTSYLEASVDKNGNFSVTKFTLNPDASVGADFF